MPIDSRFVAQALGLADAGSPRHFSAITTDSRRVSPDSLFVALPGDRYDGHEFVEEALAKGAAGAIVSRERWAKRDGVSAGPARVYEVEDSVRAFRALAGAWRARFTLPLVIVAGSAGKTTTKEMLAAILAGRFAPVLKTRGSQNGELGIPMTLLELEPAHRAAVVEVGIDEPGAMTRHLELVRPQAAIVTAIAEEHLEKLGDLSTIEREECLALEWVVLHGGALAVNLDDPRIADRASGLLGQGRRLAVAPFSLCEGEAGHDPSKQRPAGALPPGARWLGFPVFVGEIADATLLVTAPGFAREPFALPLPGRHNARNLLGAIALAAAMGESPEEIRVGLAGFAPAFGRSEIRALPSGAMVICDFYNASPASMRAGFALASEVARGRQVFLCLGDMLELGRAEERLHRELAAPIRALGPIEVHLLGARMRWLAEELPGLARHWDSHAHLAHALEPAARDPRSLILVKGSRGMRMEEVWRILSVP